jgi:hypothetical protein
VLRILRPLAAASVAIILGSCGSFQNQGAQVSPASTESGQQLYNANYLSCHGGPAGGEHVRHAAAPQREWPYLASPCLPVD